MIAAAPMTALMRATPHCQRASGPFDSRDPPCRRVLSSLASLGFRVLVNPVMIRGLGVERSDAQPPATLPPPSAWDMAKPEAHPASSAPDISTRFEFFRALPQNPGHLREFLAMDIAES